MFNKDELQCYLKPGNDAAQVELFWLWDKKGDLSTQSLNIFWCAIPETRILNEGLIGLEKVYEKIKKATGLDATAERISATDLQTYFYQNNNGMCKLFPVSITGNIGGNHMISFPYSDFSDKIIFLCIYDENSFVKKVLSIPSQKKVEYSTGVEQSWFDKVRSKIPFLDNSDSNTDLKFSIVNDTQSGMTYRVLVTQYEGKAVYSIIPLHSGDLYLDSSLTKEGITDVVPLSTLMKWD